MRKEPIGKQPCFLCENEWQEPTGLVYIPDGRAALAMALRATAHCVPQYYQFESEEARCSPHWTWWLDVAGSRSSPSVVPEIFNALTLGGGHAAEGCHRDYPTASAAIRDLCRAYIAVHCKSEVPA